MTEISVSHPIIGRSSSKIVLASESHTRRKLLEQAGVPHIVEPSRVDETEVKRSLKEEGVSPLLLAEVLAEQKAKYVSRKIPGEMVLGADQVLVIGEDTFDKPLNRADALAQLRLLRGRRHELISYAVMVRDGQRLWQAVDRAELTIRADATDNFLNAYLDVAGTTAFHSPGAYRVEWLGVQLFSNISGAHYTILGLPLMALLEYLREHGILET
ncbi:MAG: Septum formation protein Maf [Alphaproteobacteria bacterium MarineAlpha11_Bin1]|nr:MAG: Septum formation protein Maf [Alphaproteobacteria bacterium MarineAlpha11_Bin1]|tara:strand:- start:19889 stop:20530 length:642 start_codon:yes stop_codon:yes gene_type:complete